MTSELEPPPSAAEAIERRPYSYRASLVLCVLVGGFVTAMHEWFPHQGTASHAVFGALVFSWTVSVGRGLRTQSMAMALVTCLVASLIAKLAFLESMPVAPLLFFAGVLTVQYLAQLVVDL